MHKPAVVIKYGGHAMDEPALSAPFAGGLARLSARGMRLVVVHGGGPHINTMLKRLNIPSRFEHGLRVTDEAVMEVVEMVLCGQVNKSVVSLFLRHGVRAAGISGKDARLLVASRLNEELGLVGEIQSVDASLVTALLDAGFVPVIAPVAAGADGQSYNVNADTAAGALAGAMAAEYFVLISDVPGVLDADKRLIPSLTRRDAAKLVQEGVVHGGMIPKVISCLHALDEGCKRALILDGRAESSLERCLLEGAPLGTVVEG
ncbi:MAG: acetylglutamate kinase [Deltaproteobacteria bacterium]|jgi:acetylglutamate kinase|nr:acetylglutamate kinase [Deltaproteobacteria bacterium]